MSVVNIVNTGDVVHLFTDGGLYSKDGVLSAIIHKVHVIPHLNAALASRGSWNFTAKLAVRIGHGCSSFDELVENAASLYRSAYDNMILRAEGKSFEKTNTIYPNINDGIEGMFFIQQCVASSKQNGAWLPLLHNRARK